VRQIRLERGVGSKRQYEKRLENFESRGGGESKKGKTGNLQKGFAIYLR
jgi:hypothetical protein